MNAAAAVISIAAPARWLRSAATIIALGLGLLAFSDDADARLGGMFGFTDAGALAFETVTFEGIIGGGLLLPDAADLSHHGGSLGGLFNRPGLIGGFAAGFLGAGVLGLLFGHGVIGELNGPLSIIGLGFQLTLIVMLARLIWKWWRLDKAADRAELSPRQLADAYGRHRHEVLPDVDPAARVADPGEADADAFKTTIAPGAETHASAGPTGFRG